MNLDDMSKEELERLRKETEIKLQGFRDREYQEKLKNNREKTKFYRQNKDIILSLIEHGRTSCSDDNACNGYEDSTHSARCNKCYLIEVLSRDWMDDVEINFEVNLSKIT